MNFLRNLLGTPLQAKNLDDYRAQIASATSAAEKVAALFAAASLDLDAMLAAGPDSLKAHLETISAKDGELAAAQEKASELEASVTTLTAQMNEAKAATKTQADLVASLYASIGFDPGAKDKDGKAVDFKTAFGAHVAKEAVLVLAKDGRPPVTHLPVKDPKEVAKDPNAKGRDRYEADFNRQVQAMHTRR